MYLEVLITCFVFFFFTKKKRKEKRKSTISFNIIFPFCRDDNKDIQIQIIFPISFEDMDKFGNSYTFLAQHFHCVSSYTSESLLNPFEQTTEHCKVDQEFSSLNYKPSPNGDFGLKLLSNNDFDLDAIAKLKIGLKGSFVFIQQ